MNRLILLAIAGCLLAPLGHASKLYKWVDDNGRVFYSDKVPPEAAARERERLTSQGVTVEVRAAAKTPEEIAEEQRRQAEEQRRLEAEAQQREQDRILLLTYASVGDIERIRDEQLIAAQARITQAEARLAKLNDDLGTQQQRAAALERSGGGDLSEQHKKIEELRRQVSAQQAAVAEREREREQLALRFEAELARFKQLLTQRGRQTAE